MSENGEIGAREPGPLRPSLLLPLAVCVWAAGCVLWFTSERANFPLPLYLFHDTTSLPVGTNFFDLYGEGLRFSLMQTYVSLFSPVTWEGAEIGWGQIDWLGHGTAIGAIAIHTLLGVAFLGALGIRWPWFTRLAAGYALGVGVAGWVFEQWAIAHLLSRGTVLASLIVLGGGLGALWWVTATRLTVIEPGDPEVGAPFAKSTFDFVFRLLAWVLLIAVITLGFYHAVALPPTNWDALILYLGNARQTHELGGFPVKVVAQVGVGLGANYPHLFEVTQAAMTRLAGHWSPLVGQWAVPWASLCSTVLVFALAHRVFQRRDLALAAALIFRCIPYGISFSQLVSNYALAVLMTALALLAAHDWLSTGRRRLAVLMLFTAAFASHINYLMPALWPVVLLALLFRGGIEIVGGDGGHSRRRSAPPRGSWWLVALALVVTLALASTWYVRNWIVTGNPVYAFFHETLGGIHVNPDVLASADQEWLTAGGDGLGRLSSQIGERGPFGNLMILPHYLFLVPAFRWKLAPLFEGLALPGLLMILGGTVIWRRWEVFETAGRLLWWLLALAVFLGLWVYHIAVADYYLYQILPMLVPAALLATVPLTFGGMWGGSLRTLVLVTALLIGVPMSLMGFKLKGLDQQLRLQALAHPFPDRDRFYIRVFPGDVPIWRELEENWQGATLLTHDNRHLIYDPLVGLVHMDDWEVQPIYDVATPAGRLAFYRDLGVDLYLRIPGEGNHPINARAGLQSLIDQGDLRLILRSDDNALYAFPWAESTTKDR